MKPLRTTPPGHPCFDRNSASSCGRVHVPVAPKCNIQCGYCNRKYDCVNESRPGVTSAVLSPRQALEYVDKVLAADPRITVIGIAGPGDPMANPAETLETLRLIHERHPELLFCLSSNGLGLPPHLDRLKELGVTHVTVTINAVDPAIGEKLYSWVRDDKVVWRGREAAELLLARQLESVRGLVERGLIVKVNTILVPGVNDHHVEEVARVVGELGATIQNIIPLKPTADTPLAHLPEPDAAAVNAARKGAGGHISQMTHCKRCRADAVGLLHEDKSAEMAETLRACAAAKTEEAERPYVAVATREGMLVNQHLGEAARFQIWGQGASGFYLVEERLAPRPGCGPERWKQVAHTLRDCRALLCAAFGAHPEGILVAAGVRPVEASGFIEDALEVVFGNGNTAALRGRKGGVGKASCAGGGCRGTGEGC